MKKNQNGTNITIYTWLKIPTSRNVLEWIKLTFGIFPKNEQPALSKEEPKWNKRKCLCLIKILARQNTLKQIKLTLHEWIKLMFGIFFQKQTNTERQTESELATKKTNQRCWIDKFPLTTHPDPLMPDDMIQPIDVNHNLTHCNTSSCLSTWSNTGTTSGRWHNVRPIGHVWPIGQCNWGMQSMNPCMCARSFVAFWLPFHISRQLVPFSMSLFLCHNPHCAASLHPTTRLVFPHQLPKLLLSGVDGLFLEIRNDDEGHCQDWRGQQKIFHFLSDNRFWKCSCLIPNCWMSAVAHTWWSFPPTNMLGKTTLSFWWSCDPHWDGSLPWDNVPIVFSVIWVAWQRVNVNFPSFHCLICSGGKSLPFVGDTQTAQSFSWGNV